MAVDNPIKPPTFYFPSVAVRRRPCDHIAVQNGRSCLSERVASRDDVGWPCSHFDAGPLQFSEFSLVDVRGNDARTLAREQFHRRVSTLLTLVANSEAGD